MRAIWIARHGGPRVLEVRETPDPTPAAGEARVCVRAAGLNFSEVMARQGLYPAAPRPPCIVGYEGSGVVDAVGAGVDSALVGRRVIYLSRFGGHASHVCVSARHLLPMPEQMSFEHGAALPVSYLTAHHTLFNVARLREGDHVLVHMAAGGLGTALMQLCRTVDGVVTYGAASPSKHDYVRRQGATYAIDYVTGDYTDQVLGLTDGRGVDVVIDPLGGADWRKGYALLKPAGMLIACGLANVNRGVRRRTLHVVRQLLRVPRFSPLTLMGDNRSVAGVDLGRLADEDESIARQSAELLRLYERGTIDPQVCAKYPFSQAGAAHAELEERRNLGKVVLVPD